jgi:hypothetical protein
MIRCLAVVLILTAADGANASTAWQGTLYDPHFMQSGVVLVYTTGSRADIPACGAGQPARFAIDSSTAQGKAQLAGLLTAFAAKQPVVIVGTSTCSVYADSETVSYFYIDA